MRHDARDRPWGCDCIRCEGVSRRAARSNFSKSRAPQSDDVRFSAFAFFDISVGRVGIPAVFVSRCP